MTLDRADMLVEIAPRSLDPETSVLLAGDIGASVTSAVAAAAAAAVVVVVVVVVVEKRRVSVEGSCKLARDTDACAPP